MLLFLPHCEELTWLLGMPPGLWLDPDTPSCMDVLLVAVALLTVAVLNACGARWAEQWSLAKMRRDLV